MPAGLVIRAAVLAAIVWLIRRAVAPRAFWGEPDPGAAAVQGLLVLATLVSGIVCAAIVGMRVAGASTSSWLYRRSLYVFIIGNASIVPWWWQLVVKYHDRLYLTLGLPIAISAIAVIAGSMWLASRDQPLPWSPTRHTGNLQ